VDNSVLIAICVVLLIILGLPLLAHVVKANSDGTAEVAAEPEPKPEPKTTAAPSAMTPNPALSNLQPGQIPNDIQLPPGVERAQPGQPQRVAAEVRGGPPPQLNAQNLPGTAWQFFIQGEIQPITLELHPGGQAKAFHPKMAELGLPPEMCAQGFPGQWSVNNNWIRLSAISYTIEAQIVGKNIIGPEGPLRRVR